MRRRHYRQLVINRVRRNGLRTVAAFEAVKGLVVLILGFGLLGFLGREDEHFVEQLMLRMHFDPANRYLQIFIHTMSEVSDTRLWLLMGLATLYAAVRFIEGYGLWYERRWAEWFAAFSGGVYIPLEIYELVKRLTWVRFAALLLNIVVVAYMVWLLSEAKRQQAAAGKKLTSGA